MAFENQVIRFPRPPRIAAYIRSRLRPLDIDPEVVNQVLACYRLELTRPPKNLPNTRRNRNLIVETTAGKKVFKLYREDWRIQTIIHEHSILAFLAQVGFPAPRLVATPNAETYISFAGQNYALFDFACGTNYSSNFLLRAHRQILMRLAGQTLASLHQQLKGFMPQGQHHLGFKSYTGGRHRDLAWHIEKISELRETSSRIGEPEDKFHLDWLTRNSGYFLEEIGRLDEELRNAPLPRVVIHGDYGLHNLLFKNMHQAIPVDFELARLEWRLSDLVSCLSRFRYGKGPYDFESIRWFMEAYTAVYPLGNEEWQHIPQVWRFYRLQAAVQYWNSYFETNGPTRKLISARDAVAQADWAVSHAEIVLGFNPKHTPNVSSPNAYSPDAKI